MDYPLREWDAMDEATIADRDCSDWICVLPLGAHEQHGPHLPFETDTIIASGVLLGADAVENADVELLKSAAIAALLAFVAALGALAIMMRLLKRVSYTPYVVYRLILGAILLWIAYS